MNRATETTPKTVTAAKQAGRRAAASGMPYDQGRDLFSGQEGALLLAWSKGHNAFRNGRKRRA